MHSYWHCGSGLAAGADVDSLVIKDENNMPYVPGKTIKGLIKDAVEEYLSLSGVAGNYKEAFADTFGYAAEISHLTGEKPNIHKSCVFFSNAELESTEYQAIVSNNLTKYMYNSVSNTAIDKNGIAKDHSLRKTEVIVPCTLYGIITDVPDNMVDVIEKSFGMIKSLGTSRSRGLGRCTFISKRKEQEL